MTQTLTNTLERVRVAYRAAMPKHRLHRYVGRASEVFTYTSVAERLLLFEEALVALRAPGAGGRCLEIGSYLGASAAVLAEAMRWAGHGDAGRVFCIDTWQNDAMTEGQRDTYEEFLRNTADWPGLIVPIRGASTEVDLPTQQSMDLVFIDGDHSYEAARADVERFAPMVADGGRLVMHDHRSKPGVTRVLGEVLTTGQWVIQRCVESIVSLRRVPQNQD